jgi:hypothetical protein
VKSSGASHCPQFISGVLRVNEDGLHLFGSFARSALSIADDPCASQHNVPSATFAAHGAFNRLHAVVCWKFERVLAGQHHLAFGFVCGSVKLTRSQSPQSP